MTEEPLEAADILRTGLPPANDRMLTTCFLAALFHAIVILGVTFSAPSFKGSGQQSADLEVLLVNDLSPKAAANPHAHYLAQRTQLGSGNTLKPEHTRIPKSSLMPIERMGVPSGEGIASQQSGTEAGEAMIATHVPAQRILYFASSTAANRSEQLPLLLEKRPDLAMAANDDGVELRMRGEALHQLWIAADTRESDVAVYLDGWRRKVERVGTMNFPNVARRQKLSGTPVIEVTIGSDGKLLQTLVKRTSGHLEMDEAAMRILKLAAPYEPFSSELALKHDQIRIAYEWQFLGGASPGTGVFYTEPNN